MLPSNRSEISSRVRCISSITGSATFRVIARQLLRTDNGYGDTQFRKQIVNTREAFCIRNMLAVPRQQVLYPMMRDSRDVKRVDDP